MAAEVSGASAMTVLGGYAVIHCIPCLVLLSIGVTMDGTVPPRLDALQRRLGTGVSSRNPWVATALALLGVSACLWAGPESSAGSALRPCADAADGASVEVRGCSPERAAGYAPEGGLAWWHLPAPDRDDHSLAADLTYPKPPPPLPWLAAGPVASAGAFERVDTRSSSRLACPSFGHGSAATMTLARGATHDA